MLHDETSSTVWCFTLAAAHRNHIALLVRAGALTFSRAPFIHSFTHTGTFSSRKGNCLMTRSHTSRTAWAARRAWTGSFTVDRAKKTTTTRSSRHRHQQLISLQPNTNITVHTTLVRVGYARLVMYTQSTGAVKVERVDPS
jgi:hypothetical protein